jgi:hypothetical protein
MFNEANFFVQLLLIYGPTIDQFMNGIQEIIVLVINAGRNSHSPALVKIFHFVRVSTPNATSTFYSRHDCLYL